MAMRIYKIRIIPLVLNIILIFFAHESFAANGSFYNQDNMYRGFYWFEEPEISKQGKKKDILTNDKQLLKNMTPAFAKMRIEERKKRLNEAKAMMLEYAFSDASPEVIYEHIRKYKELESQMFNGSIRLGKASQVVAFTNPEIADQINNPINALGNKIRRKQEEDERKQKIAEFVGKYDLVLFEKIGCPYCREFGPIFERFTSLYGFTYEKTYLSAEKNKALLARLAVDGAPTVVAVSKDGSDAFELTRGVVTISEIEEMTSIAMDYLDEHLQAKARVGY